jgi:dihydrolipoamide dehydrogenase
MSVKNFDAVVIGAGPGGYVCAIRLAQLGKKTAIIEKDKFGGVCLNVGCIPSKALIHSASTVWNMQHEAPEMGISTGNISVDYKKMVAWKDTVVKKMSSGVSSLLKANGVESIKGTAVFKDAKTLTVGSDEIKANAIVIATGSRVVEIPSVPYNGKNVLSSTEALDLTTVPKRSAVIGGGFIGLEIGTVFAKLGSEVTIIEASDQLLSSVDKELVQVVERKLKTFKVTVMHNSKVLGLKESKSDLKLEVDVKGEKKVVETDCILVSVGRKPNSDGIGLEKIGVKLDARGNIITNNQGMTNVPGIYAIGDVSGPPQLAHRASMDGLLVAAAINGEKSFKDYKTVPWAVFCDPEIATAGLSEKEATEKGIKYRVGKFPFAASGKATATNETEGFVKVLINEANETLLGVHIVGPQASAMIAEAALAIEMGACAEDIERTIHTHPTLPEAFPEAIEQAFSKAIHIYKPQSAKR